MRITGGRFAGRPLRMPRGPRIRATQERVRQALFNLLGERVAGARVLDLFCGCGAVGIEALSRGAARATFVDRSGFCVETVRKNLETLWGLTPRGQTPFALIRAEAEAAIRRLDRAGERFDLIFLDPPYGEDLVTKTLIALSRCAIVPPAGWIVVELHKRDPLPDLFKLQRIERYGDTALAIYERQ